jgi:hypothetical protein
MARALDHTPSSGLEVKRSARRPGPELIGVEDCPDVGDTVAGDIELVHRHCDAVLLGHQAGLAVDRTLRKVRLLGARRTRSAR